MAAEVRPLEQAKLPARPSSLTPEQTYWHTFKSPLNIASPTKHAITHVSQPAKTSNSSLSDYFVVTTGARVQLYSVRTRKLVKSITRFDDTAYSGEVRYDGRVLVAGDDTGTIQVFDVNSRAILKTWKEQKQAVHVTKWSHKESTALMSCGDDNTVRLWDLPSESSVTVFRGHQDYVRSGCFLPGHNGNLLVSGSYDQTVRLWDARTPASPVMSFKHIASVEDVLCMPSGTSMVAAADNQVAVLDIVAGKPIRMIKNHQKTVTSLCLASQGSRLVTGGLDGHMKVFETTGWNVVAGSKYPAPILSVNVISSGIVSEDKHIVVGMANGQLSIKTKLSGDQKAKEKQKQKEMEALLAGTIEEYDRKQAKKRGRGWEKRLRGRDYAGENADTIIDGNQRKPGRKPKSWENAIHKQQFGDALDLALKEGHGSRTIILSVLNTLRYRSSLRAALENRNEASLRPIMEWVHRNISTPELVPICVELSMNIMDLYSKHLGESEELEIQATKLYARVKEEVDRAQQATMTRGMLELLMPPVEN